MTRPRSLVFAALLSAVAAVTVAPPARAQGDAPVTDAERARARAQFDRGVERFAAGDFTAALAAFQGAYAAQPHPVVRVNIASCHEKLGNAPAALTEYELFLEEMTGQRSDKRAEVLRAVRRLRKAVATLELRVEPASAVIRIDGEVPVMTVPSSRVNLLPGAHTVEVSSEGYRPLYRDVMLRPGKPVKLALRLDAQEIEETPVESPPEAPAMAVAPEDEPAGAAEGDGGASVFTTRVLVTGALTLGLAAGAAVTGVVALGAKGDFDDAVKRSGDPALSDAQREAAYQDGVDASSKANTFSLVSDLLLAGTVIGAGLTVYFILTEEGDAEAPTTAKARRNSREAVWLAPYVAPTGAGAVLQGSF